MVAESRPEREPEEPLAWPELFLNNIFLLLFLGLLIPTLLYILWGLWELVTVPSFPH